MANWPETVYGTQDIDGHEVESDFYTLPEIPDMFKAEPAVLEAVKIIQGRSISRAVPGRVVR